MPSLPAFILACPRTTTLLLRAIAGELPRGDYYAAWDALPQPDAYEPSEEVRQWMQANWRALVPAAEHAPLATMAAPQAPAAVEPPVLTEEWMEPFLEEYKKEANLTQSAKAGPVSRDTVYEYLRHDPEFARAFKEAESVYKDTIRSTIKRRSIDGWEEPVFGMVETVVEGRFVRSTGVVGYVRKHDNRLLIRMAESALEEYASTSAGAKININNSNTANASAQAAAGVVATPAKQADIQTRTRHKLAKRVERARLAASPAPVKAAA